MGEYWAIHSSDKIASESQRQTEKRITPMKLLISVFKTLLFLATATIASFGLSKASAQSIISINVATATTGNSAIDGSESFGLSLPNGDNTTVGASGWNNLLAPSNPTTGSSLIDSTGATQALSYTLSRPAGATVSGNAAWANTTLQAGLGEYPATTGNTQIGVTSGLSSYFSSTNGYAGYYAIVYIGGFANQAVNMTLIGSTNANRTGDATTYYFRPVSPVSSVTWSQISNTSNLGDNNNPAGNYAIYGSKDNPLTSDTYYVTLDSMTSSGTFGAYIGGVQFVGVAIPEPSTYAALAGLGALGLVMWKRRRRAQVTTAKSA